LAASCSHSNNYHFTCSYSWVVYIHTGIRCYYQVYVQVYTCRYGTRNISWTDGGTLV